MWTRPCGVYALHHLTGLLSTIAWLIRWPSFTEIWCCLSLVPLLFIPFPTILNNMLEWVMYLVMGEPDGYQKDTLYVWSMHVVLTS